MVGRWCAVVLLLALLCITVHAASDEEKLATLAARMLNLTQDVGTGDYVMECGPADEVLNTKPTTLHSTHYCILNASGKMVIGTFDDPTQQNVERTILRVYNDSQFSAQIDTARFSERACDGKGTTGFEECTNAIRTKAGAGTLSVYYYDDELSSGANYVLISDAPLNSVRGKKTIFGAVAEFFRGMFA
jgi:hypothetical protein